MRYLYLLLSLLSVVRLAGQAPDQPTAGELHAAIEKLGVLGSALYVAAHPDDENTRMIAYLANVAQVETGYLSMTRGDGGQNLIASDIGELLGLTRTQELLAARRIDGGRQFFTRANDFGYSKHPDETFTIWDKQEVLADAVYVIRQQRPDVMILRFDPRAPGSTHGHHTASAIIGMEAFDLAGDPEAFPEQLSAGIEPWQPKRLYWNAYSWGSDTLPDYVDSNDVITVEINKFLPRRGESVAEIAARSRSQHKSQGFGSSGSRAATVEKLELLKGETNGVNEDPFAGIVTDWSRVPGGEESVPWSIQSPLGSTMPIRPLRRRPSRDYATSCKGWMTSPKSGQRSGPWIASSPGCWASTYPPLLTAPTLYRGIPSKWCWK